MREDRSDRLELSFVQLAASTLAAVSSAVAAAYLGIAGTVTGAAVGSVIATVGTAVYQHYLERTRQRLRTLPMLVRGAGSGAVGKTWWEALREVRWRPLVAGCVLVFATTLAVLTTVETITREPLPEMLGKGNGDDRTTISRLLQPDDGERRQHRPVPWMTPATPALDPTPAGTHDPTTPGESPAPSEPSARTPSLKPTKPAREAASEPAREPSRTRVPAPQPTNKPGDESLR
ncbi:hypothetical protein TH66_07700 [Carbonactinospora thermoautotrophica]|uniref:Uncharacterized protein n=2 Tax=Carbonactinospora thermoautotrophica TaxID=1469144 RepID=A0A132N2Y9_9ACTN|nr:hypothetical protein [Carbonactinospora thermoautotrophica]KWX04453.1 hypothetical protein TH66_07700 [Carbonactinospora thermoautotrophica]